MEQAQTTKSKDQLGSQEKNEFLMLMDSLFPDQNLLNENSKYRKKADLTFEIMQTDEWEIAEFRDTMMQFARTYSYANWMPANIIAIWKELYGQFDEDGFPINKNIII